MWVRSEVSNRWRSWLASVVLVGLFGGAVLASAAGARRTDTAYSRFLRASQAGEVFISPFVTLLRGSYDEIRQLPQVADAGMVGVPLMAAVGPSGSSNFLVFSMASADGRFGYAIHRPNVLDGRLPHPERATEALVDPATARRFRLAVGGQLTMRAFAEPPADPADIRPGEGTPVTLTVVGIGVFPDQVVPTQPLEEFPRLFLSPAAYRLYGASPESMVYEEIFVRLEPGADVDAFRAQVERITAADPGAGGHDFSTGTDRIDKVERAIRPQATALALFALLAAVVGLFVVGQTLARQVHLESTEYPILRALGMTRGQLVAISAVRVGSAALAGGLLAVGLAIALSPLTPIGPARLAEPDPGTAVDMTLLGGGVAFLVLVLLAVTAWPMWRTASSPAGVLGTAELAGVDRPSRLVSALSRVGAPVVAVAGVRLAVEPGRGRSAVPVRNTLAATTLAMIALIAALTFGASLERLISNPSRYGKTWDAAVDGGYTMLPAGPIMARLHGDPTVVGFSGGTPGDIVVGGRQVPAMGIDRLQGDVFPTLLEGRPPTANDEIVLGTKVLRRLRRSVGDRVEVEIGGSTRDGSWAVPCSRRSVCPATGTPASEKEPRSSAVFSRRSRLRTRTRRTSTTSSSSGSGPTPPSRVSSGSRPTPTATASSVRRVRPTRARVLCRNGRVTSPTTPGCVRRRWPSPACSSC